MPPDAHRVSVTSLIPAAASPGETVSVHVAVAAAVELGWPSEPWSKLALSVSSATSLRKSLETTILCLAPVQDHRVRDRRGETQNEPELLRSEHESGNDRSIGRSAPVPSVMQDSTVLAITASVARVGTAVEGRQRADRGG